MPESPAEPPALPPEHEEERPLPVLAEPRPVERTDPPSLPAVVAAGTVGFFAGVLAWTLVRVLRRPRGSRAVSSLGRRRAKGIEIAGTRSFLVDVHLIKR